MSSEHLFWDLAHEGHFKAMNDKIYLKNMYRSYMKKKLDFKNVVTFNEKLQWLKIYDRNPIYTKMVDKFEVKKIISAKIGENYVIPTLGVWNTTDEIEFKHLPERFVLKTTHDSGGVSICRNKAEYDIEEAKKTLQQSLEKSHYQLYREWPYKDVKPRIIAEKYITDDERNGILTDYKFYCFDGYVDCVMACYGRETGNTKYYFFDKDWKLLRINHDGMEAKAGFSKPVPSHLSEMFNIASILSHGIPFARVDLYQISNQVLFGEITFFPQAGFDKNYIYKTDLYFGSLIQISKAYSNRK